MTTFGLICGIVSLGSLAAAKWLACSDLEAYAGNLETENAKLRQLKLKHEDVILMLLHKVEEMTEESFQ